MVETKKILSQLEKVLLLRSSTPRTIELSSIPGATDGKKIYIGTEFSHFQDEADNRLMQADIVDHEHMHILEFEEYFARQPPKNDDKSVNGYIQECYGELKHVHLASWIDNIVKDRRIDAQRREEFPGSKRLHEKRFVPAAKYFRPSTRLMNELNTFRELYLQQAFLGGTLKTPSQKHKRLLDEVVEKTNQAETIFDDERIVKDIYNVFIQNFKIDKKLLNLPPLFSRRKHQGQGATKPMPRDSQHKPKKPEFLKDKTQEEKKEETPAPSQKGQDLTKSGLDGNDKKRYNQIGKSTDFGVRVYNGQRDFVAYQQKMQPHIDEMLALFQDLLKPQRSRYEMEGSDLDYERHLQNELEQQVTGITPLDPVFTREPKLLRKIHWAIHADISPSTNGKEFELIQKGFYTIGSALAQTPWNFSLYASSGELLVLKTPYEEFTDTTRKRIASLRVGDAKGSGIRLKKTTNAIGMDMLSYPAHTYNLIHISDFGCCDFDDEPDVLRNAFNQGINPFLVGVGIDQSNINYYTSSYGLDYGVALDSIEALPDMLGSIIRRNS